MINCTAIQLASWVVSCSPPGSSSSEAVCVLWVNCHFLTPSSNRGKLRTLLLLFNMMKTQQPLVLPDQDKKTKCSAERSTLRFMLIIGKEQTANSRLHIRLISKAAHLLVFALRSGWFT